MLTAVLFVLKIIGLILLVILGLILFLILAVLLVPIRYRAEGSYQSKPVVKATLSWFLHALSFKMVYEETFCMRIRILGIPIKCFDGNSEDTEEDDGSRSETEKTEPKRSEPTKPETITLKSEEFESGKSESEKPMPEKAKAEKKKRRHAGREPVWKRIRERFEQLYGRWNAIWSWIQNEENKQMIRLIKRQIFGIVRHILPGEISGRIKFGFDDPFKTGQILTYISPFYGFYAKKLEVIPVFEESVLEGEVRLKGRIRIGTIVAKAVRLLFNKNIRKTIRQFRDR